MAVNESSRNADILSMPGISAQASTAPCPEELAADAVLTSATVLAQLRASTLDSAYWALHDELSTALAHARKPAPTRVLYTDEILGNALFATTIIGAGQFIGEYTGVLRRAPRAEDPALPYATALFPAEAKLLPSARLVLDAADEPNSLRCMNHLGSHVKILYPDQRQELGPNACFLPVYVAPRYRIAVVALRPIAIGDELRADYGDGYFTARGAPSPIARLYEAGTAGVRRIAG